MQHKVIADFLGARAERAMCLATHVDREFRSGVQRSKAFADFVCSDVVAEVKVADFRDTPGSTEFDVTERSVRARIPRRWKRTFN